MKKRLILILALASLITGIIIIDSCKKDASLATLSTTEITNVTVNSLMTGGSITKDGGADISARGVCYGTSADPVVTGPHTSDATGVGSFVSNVTGLTPNTLYHIRAYATNKAGTAYGDELTATTTPVVIPSLTTADVTSITLTTAVSGGNISSDGNATVTARGVCWATTASPTIANDKTTDGTGIGTFVSNLATLTPGTTYHVRSYATNSAGTGYGNEVTFTTTAVGVASLTTTAVTSITLTSAVSGGNVISDGGSSITARGVCWATATNPTTAGSKTTDGTGTGAFTSNITGLTAGTTYYVRAYATNSAGTAYGNEVSFTASLVQLPTLTTTAVSSTTQTSTSSGGNILSNGGGTISARGVCWSTAANPTISNFATTDGTGTGSFTSSVTGLTPGTTYHLRAYAVNGAGTAYGNEVVFTTNPILVPTLTTTAITLITQISAVSGGNITADGGGAVTARGVCWATTVNPTIADSKTTDGTGTGIFGSNITGLTVATTYYVRAYATNSAGTAYGNEISFTSSPVALATLTTTVAGTITQTTATTGGNITADGGAAITERGVCWATSANPTTANSKTSDGTGSGNFTSNLTGLTAGTLYHIRAFAINSAGTAYGDDLTFTTNPVGFATLTTEAATLVTLTTASSGGNVTADGAGAVTARGVCWSTTPTPTIGDAHTTNGSGMGSFTSSITGLTEGTPYYVRAYATNSAGTAYGNEIVLSTQIVDIEGNHYNTVLIGTQVWMAQNLATTHYNTNVAIPNITVDANWAADTVAQTPAYCWYNNDAANKDVYGALYNWYAVATTDLCPDGWHVADDDEFITLEVFLGMDPAHVLDDHWRGTTQGNMLKSTSWLGGTNTSGFTALPGGYRAYISGQFNDAGNLTYFWTSTETPPSDPTTWYRRLDTYVEGTANIEGRIFRAGVNKAAGKYVRCIKN